MLRYTERDEFGNADIKSVDSGLLYENLEFDEMNKLTYALNRLADFEDLCEELNIDGPKGSIEALRQKLGFIRFSDGYDEENQKDVHKIEYLLYADEYPKLNKQYIKYNKGVNKIIKAFRDKCKNNFCPNPTTSGFITLDIDEVEKLFKEIKGDISE